MLKWLAILGLFLTCTPVYGHKESPKPHSNQESAEPVEHDAPNPPPVSIINSVNQQAAQGKCDNANNQSDSYLRHLLMPETLANIGLFLVGIVGALIALRTIRNSLKFA
jgi:hypothetical protein